ncbi:MAG: carbon-nitrogen hydrolase family protein [Caldisphaera sp.]|jgi:predicted amidohydrolase|nr:carbon-nitrogen hydrolase family protein [Caldisphaera sp.]PMP59646.1 MAG: hypothetical protein C0201_04415 [Caldisphaera sp.]
MKPIRIVITQFRRRSTTEENFLEAMTLLDGFKGIPAFSENWLLNKPLNIDDYYYYIDKLGNKLKENILGGIQYVYEKDVIKSVGLAFIDNKVIKICEKINASKAVYERGFISKGKYIYPISVDDWKIGCIGCVDIFYPEISRIHTINGANILYNPASISEDSIKLWHSVLSARASENMSFSIGVNNTKTVYPDGRITGGQSIVFNPHGDMLVSLGSQDFALPIDLEPDLLDYVENRWAFKDDLNQIYSKYYIDLMNDLK